MPYRIPVDAPVAPSIRAIAREQIEKAISDLQTAANLSRAVHNARKSFKRTRALLHLVRPFLKPKIFKQENQRIVTVARQLSDARDAKVMLDAVALLETDDANLEPALLMQLKAWLQARLERKEEGLEAQDILTALETLRVSRDNLTALPMDEAAFDDLLEAAQSTYARGRDHMRAALSSEDDEACHDWRKFVQRHWRHMRLFQEAWPDETKARMALAKALADALGRHHDLSVLSSAIEANGALFSHRRDIETLKRLIAKRQEALLAQAALLGERLYVEKPKAFLKRMGVYLATAQEANRRQQAAAMHNAL